ncbi:MAG TPA: energy transducer TonB [Allosphingosinicella sp.]|nr:energy transducer TonB [Allosphingosinicella sp.]
MPENGFLAHKPRSPGSLAVVLALHAAAITALAMSKMEVPTMKIFTPLKLKPVRLPPDPPPVPDPIPPKAHNKSVIEHVTPIVATHPLRPVTIREPKPLGPIVIDVGPPGGAVVPPRADPPPPPPVRIDAQIDPRSELQPPYPASEERAGREGSVAVRVLIGADGRVKGIERVRAASEAFWRTTERHALRHWRFRPATVDGRPVASSKVMTVHFQLRA